jgi:hypothetical protein
MRKIFLISMFVLLLASCSKPQKWSGTAPDFKFTSFAGKNMSLSALGGKPVVLNFWADW